jgi:hypothetical protein
VTRVSTDQHLHEDREHAVDQQRRANAEETHGDQSQGSPCAATTHRKHVEANRLTAQLSRCRGLHHSRSTIEGMIEENDGMDSASVIPTSSESPIIIQGRPAPASSSATISIGHSICTEWNP